MSDCGRYLEMLSAFMDGELDSSLRNVLSEHINSCRSCYNAALSYKEINELIADESSMEDPPRDIASTVMSRINREENTAQQAEQKSEKKGFLSALPARARRYAALAAAVVVLVVAVLAAPAIFKGSSTDDAKVSADTVKAVKTEKTSAAESSSESSPAAAGSVGSVKNSSPASGASQTPQTSVLQTPHDSGVTAGGAFEAEEPSSAEMTAGYEEDTSADAYEAYPADAAESEEAPASDADEPVRDGGSGADGAFFTGTQPEDSGETDPGSSGSGSSGPLNSGDEDGSAALSDTETAEAPIAAAPRSYSGGDITDALNSGPLEINGYSCGAIMVLDEGVDPPDVLEQYEYYSWEEENSQYLIINGELFDQLTDTLNNMKMPYTVDRYGSVDADNWLLLITAQK